MLHFVINLNYQTFISTRENMQIINADQPNANKNCNSMSPRNMHIENYVVLNDILLLRLMLTKKVQEL